MFGEKIKMIMLNYDFLWELWKAVRGTNEVDQSLFIPVDKLIGPVKQK